MEPAAGRPVLAPVGGSSRLPTRVIVVAAILVGIAIAKPWQLMAGVTPDSVMAPRQAVPLRTAVAAESTAPQGSAAGTTVGAEPEPSHQPGTVECRDPIGWRLVTLERVSGGATRSWTAVQPEVARSPADVTIVSTRVTAAGLIAVGFCGDGQHAGTGPAIVGSAWRQAGDGSWAAQLVLAMSAGSGADGTSNNGGDGELAAIYQSAVQSRQTPAPSPWLPGRYVFRVSYAAWPGMSYWFGLEVD